MKKYGIEFSNGAQEMRADWDVIAARYAARDSVKTGESVSVFSVSETGVRSTLEIITQPHVISAAEFFG